MVFTTEGKKCSSGEREKEQEETQCPAPGLWKYVLARAAATCFLFPVGMEDGEGKEETGIVPRLGH